jgi:hypothetical protein
MVSAFRTRPEKIKSSPIENFARIERVNGRTKMPGIWMIGGVGGNGNVPVVYRRQAG